jgi:large subunit ribosomal protein L25
MSNEFQLEAVVRSAHGKGGARRMRAAGHVPAIVYAAGKPATAVGVPPKEFTKAVMGAHKRNALIHLNLKDEAGKSVGTRSVMVKELQIHPVKRNAIHIDFLEVNPNTPVACKVPFEATGKSKAIVQGAKLQLVVRVLNISVAPNAIPEKIVMDVTEAGFGVLRASEVPMPKGATLIDPADMPVVSLRMPRGEKEEEAAPAAAAAPAAKGAAAKPAAAAAPAAKAPAKK